MTTAIETYVYAEPAARFVDAWIARDTGGGPVVSRITTPTRWTDALTAWDTGLGAGYSVTYDAGTDRVTIAGPGVFDLMLGLGTQALLGFALDMYGGSASYTAESGPCGYVPLRGASVGPVEDRARVDARTYRHGRAYAPSWLGPEVYPVTLTCSEAQLARLLARDGEDVGYCLSGRVRVYQSSASPLAADEPGGYLDGWVAGVKAEPIGDESWWTVTLRVARDPSATVSEPETVGGAQRYGWGVTWALHIEGVPYVFTERATGYSLPAGYVAEDVSLLVDDSGEIGSIVDRTRGIGAGYDLSWRLADTAVVRALLKAPTHVTYLTADASTTADPLTVDDTTGWPASGLAYLGRECVAYTGLVAGLSGLTRGVAGWPYAHRPASGQSVVADTPRYWRGRIARLYACPVDPGGLSTMDETDAELVWIGRISADPKREAGAFAFSASCLDRVLDVALPEAPAGRIAKSEVRYVVDPSEVRLARLRGFDSSGAQVLDESVSFLPYSTLTPGTAYTGAELRDAWLTAWAAAVTDQVPTYLTDDAAWVIDPSPEVPVDKSWRWLVVCANLGGVAEVHGYLTPPQGVGWGATKVLGASVSAQIGPAGYAWGGSGVSALGASVSLDLESGSAADCPAAGRARIEPESGSPYEVEYAYSTTDADGRLVLAGLKSPTGAYLFGGSARVLGEVKATADLAALQLIESSGTGARGAYDSLPRGQGYGVDDELVDEASFAVDGVKLDLAAPSSGVSLADSIGGLLALTQRGVVADPLLRLVDTAPSGGVPTVTLTDADLLCLSDAPLVAESRVEAATQIKITRKPAGSESEDTLILTDLPACEAQGTTTREWMVPAQSREALRVLADGHVAALLATDQTAQIVQVRVGPWCPARIGDLVTLTTLHPDVWDYAAGEPGYDGIARVLGRQQSPRTHVVTLTLLLGGAMRSTALSPSALIVAWGAGSPPATIDVDDEHADWLAGLTAPFDLRHYQPGYAESIADTLTVSGVATVGGVRRLTVSAWGGAAWDAARVTYVTLPETAGASTAQKAYMHDADETYWQ